MATFSDWTNGRRPLHLSTNSFSEEIAFQNWRPFKEAFAPELVQRAVLETSAALGRPVKTCIDPFGGSGTTALACQFLGVTPTTIEVNPYLADLIEAKISTYCVDTLARSLQRILVGSRLELTQAKALQYFGNAPKTFVEPGVKERYIFGKEAASHLALLFSRISKLRDEKCRRLLRVLLASQSVEMSNVVVSGKGRRYRKNWRQRHITKQGIEQTLQVSVLAAIYDISRFSDRPVSNFTLLRGDARELIADVPNCDLAVFSPPYPNSFDYTDVYNVELWVGGYLKSSAENRRLRNQTIRSHVQIKRAYSTELNGSQTLILLNNRIRASTTTLWNRSIPDMVISYFDDMTQVMKKLLERLNPGGRAYAVVGNSRYAGIEIDVATILIELCNQIGLTLVYRSPFRSMRSSPQQGGKRDLEETLVVFAKPVH